MVTKVNGFPQRGVWFSADVAFLNINVTGGDFVNDCDGVNGADSDLEAILELVQQHGTVIALSLESATEVNLMVDYAQQYATDGTTIGNGPASTIVTDLVTAIDAIAGLSGTAVVVADGFVALDTV